MKNRFSNLMSSGSVSLDRSDAFENDPLITFITGEFEGPVKTSSFSTHALLRANNRYKGMPSTSKDAYSLLNLALKYHNLSAVELMVKAGVENTQTTESMKGLLRDLFCTSPLSYHIGITSQIYSYLESNPAFAKIIKETDRSILNRIFVESAGNSALESLKVMLDKELVSDINVTDSSGHTALYYISAALGDASDSEDNTRDLKAIEARLMGMGAALNTDDQRSLSQQQFYMQLESAIKTMDTSAATQLFSKLLSDPDSLTDQQFHSCLIQALKTNNIEAVKSLIACPNMANVELFGMAVRNNITDVNIADMLSRYAIETNAIERIEKDFHVQLKSLSHRIGLSGKIFTSEYYDLDHKKDVAISLEGNSEQDSTRCLREVLGAYSATHPSFLPLYDAINYTTNTASIEKPEVFRDLMMSRYRDEKNIIISSGWFGHSIGVGVRFNAATNKTYISVSNRGGGSLAACLVPGSLATKLTQETGTIIYELDGQLDNNFFVKFGSHSNKKLDNQKNFSDGLFSFLAGSKAVAVLPAGSQSQGTCSYVNTKRVCEGLLYIDQFIAAKGDVNQDVMNQVRAAYKAFSSADKDSAYDDLLKLHQEISSQPPSLKTKYDLEALEEFMVAVFIQRGSIGVNSETLHTLYQSLPDTMHTKIPESYRFSETPTSLLKTQAVSRGPGFFDKPPREKIAIVGESKYVKLHDEKLGQLIAFLKDNGLNGVQIKKIKVDADSITVCTQADRAIKAKIRDDIFKNKLKAEIKNVDGMFEFVVKGFGALTINQEPTNQQKL